MLEWRATHARSARQGGQRAGDEAYLGQRFDVVGAVFNDDAVTIQEDRRMALGNRGGHE